MDDDDNDDDELILLCRDFFGISPDFAVGQLMTRGNEKACLFYVTPTLKQLIEDNQTSVNICTLLDVLTSAVPINKD